MIVHQENGYLADYKSSADLAKGMAWGLNSVSYKRLSATTREITLEQFSKEISVEKHLELYSSIINKNPES